MRTMNRKLGVTFLFSTHDPAVMAHARREVKLHDGAITEIVDHDGRDA
jgi:putative ABC transport system ATP-binding protein